MCFKSLDYHNESFFRLLCFTFCHKTHLFGTSVSLYILQDRLRFKLWMYSWIYIWGPLKHLNGSQQSYLTMDKLRIDNFPPTKFLNLHSIFWLPLLASSRIGSADISGRFFWIRNDYRRRISFSWCFWHFGEVWIASSLVDIDNAGEACETFDPISRFTPKATPLRALDDLYREAEIACVKPSANGQSLNGSLTTGWPAPKSSKKTQLSLRLMKQA